MMDAQAKLEAFEGLLTELSAAMADMVQAANDKTTSMDEIAATLAEMREAIGGGKVGQLEAGFAATFAITCRVSAATIGAGGRTGLMSPSGASSIHTTRKTRM